MNITTAEDIRAIMKSMNISFHGHKTVPGRVDNMSPELRRAISDRGGFKRHLAKSK